MPENNEHQLATWIAFQFSVRPAGRGIPYIQLPLVAAVKSGDFSTIISDEEVLAKCKVLKVDAERLPDVILEAFKLNNVRDPKPGKTR